jgi:phage protein D
VTLAQFEHDPVHDRFYAPSFTIKVGGKDVLRDLFLAVTSVSVDLKERTAGRFSFTIASSFDWETHEFLATEQQKRMDLLEVLGFGLSVEITLGYGDASHQKTMIQGVVTELGTSLSAESTPELTISGADGLYPLTVGHNTRHWEKKPDSFAVETVAALHNLKPDVDRTSPVIPRIDQTNESDLSFLERLADRNAATFYERNGRLRFGPRRREAAAVAELILGQGLLSFNPEASLGRQIAEVRVHGRSDGEGRAIVGIARTGEETGVVPAEVTGGDQTRKFLPRPPVLNVRAPVTNQEEADARAQAILDERAQKFVTGSGESVGLPEILPDTRLALEGIGRNLSKTYYVTAATHKIDGSGYRTTFQVEEKSLQPQGGGA